MGKHPKTSQKSVAAWAAVGLVVTSLAVVGAGVVAPGRAQACSVPTCSSFAPEPNQIFPANHVAFALPAWAQPPIDLRIETTSGEAIPGEVKRSSAGGTVAFVPLAPLEADRSYRFRYGQPACVKDASPATVDFSTTAAAPLPTTTGTLALVSQTPAGDRALELGFVLTPSAELARFGNAVFPVFLDGRYYAGRVSPPFRYTPGQPVAFSVLITCGPGSDADGWTGSHTSCGSIYKAAPAGRRKVNVPAYIWGISDKPAATELAFEVTCGVDGATAVVAATDPGTPAGGGTTDAGAPDGGATADPAPAASGCNAAHVGRASAAPAPLLFVMLALIARRSAGRLARAKRKSRAG